MINKNSKFRSVWGLILGLSLLSFGTFARADGDRGERYQHDKFRYHHHDGRWYTHDEAPNIQVNL